MWLQPLFWKMLWPMTCDWSGAPRWGLGPLLRFPFLWLGGSRIRMTACSFQAPAPNTATHGGTVGMWVELVWSNCH